MDWTGFEEAKALRIPGPAPVPPRVARAAGRAMINHRSPEFKELLEGLTRRLQEVFGTKSPVYILTGSGTAALEAAVANTIGPGDRVLVLVGGFFGQRWVEIAKAFGAEVEVYEYPWNEGADPEEVERRLRHRPEIAAVLATHNESSTGVTNDMEAISKARGRAGSEALLIVDSVSGLGGAPLPVDEWDLDVVATASQKCLMTPPGLAFVSMGPRARQRMEKAGAARYYLDLRKYQSFFERGQTPWTPALSLLFGLEEALAMMQLEGLEAAISRHRLMRDMVRAGVEALGLEPFVRQRWASPTVTAVKAPENLDVDAFRKVVNNQLGVILSGGQGKLAGQVFRVGHMGYATPLEMLTALAAIEQGLARIGRDVRFGAGVAAAQEVWRHWPER